METTINTKSTVNDLHNRIQQHLEELAQETDKARISIEMTRYLDFCARFHRYSSGNVWLIMFANPSATHVAGYQTWRSMNRYVRKGEKGIPVLAPLLYKKDPDDENSPIILNGFRTVHVFDVGQTEGEPLPAQPDWKSPEKNAELNEKLIRFAKNMGITVTFRELPGETQGLSKGGAIEISPNAGTKTLIHELSHELLHCGEFDCNNRATKEMEAEAVAYVVSKFCNISGLKSPNYISLFGLGGKEILESISKIFQASQQLISALTLEV